MSIEFYAQNIRGIIDEVNNDMIKMSSSDYKTLAVQTCLDKLRGAKNSIDDMERELILVPINEKTQVTNRIKGYRNEIANLEEKLQNGKQRAMLLGDASNLPSAPKETYDDAANAMSETVKI